MLAVEAGMNTIEHAYWANEELFQATKKKGCVFVPSLGVCEVLHAKRFSEIKSRVKLAYDCGVRLACGADTGPGTLKTLFLSSG